ncbi:MAG: zf-HC2 domain-containing protein, partial [Bacteroidetes bacterium]|nr:zf-HC2 domain-containing protein [Bacteroidota bacterium]
MDKLGKIFGTSACIPQDTMQAYLDGMLDGKESNRVERHLVDCEMCRDEMEGMSLIQSDKDRKAFFIALDGDIDAAAGKKKVRWMYSDRRIVLAAAASLAVIVISVLTLYNYTKDDIIPGIAQQVKTKDGVSAVNEVENASDASVKDIVEDWEQESSLEKDAITELPERETVTGLLEAAEKQLDDPAQEEESIRAEGRMKGAEMSGGTSAATKTETINFVLSEETIESDNEAEGEYFTATGSDTRTQAVNRNLSSVNDADANHGFGDIASSDKRDEDKKTKKEEEKLDLIAPAAAGKAETGLDIAKTDDLSRGYITGNTAVAGQPATVSEDNRVADGVLGRDKAKTADLEEEDETGQEELTTVELSKRKDRQRQAKASGSRYSSETGENIVTDNKNAETGGIRSASDEKKVTSKASNEVVKDEGTADIIDAPALEQNAEIDMVDFSSVSSISLPDYRSKAMEQYNADDFSEAVVNFRAYLKNVPADPGVTLYMAISYLNLNKP